MATFDTTFDVALSSVVADLTQEFEDILVGVYLEGSFAWDNAIATSDLDLRVVTSNRPTEENRQRVATIKNEAMVALGREVGITLDLMDDLFRVGAVRFQRSHHLAGRDIRSLVPMKSVSGFARDSLSSARRLVLDLRTLHGSPAEFPVGAPLPGSEFRGYDTQRVLDAGHWIASSKRLITNVMAVATAHVAIKANRYVFTKADVPLEYSSAIGDAWSVLVTETYEVCRQQWAYRLPLDHAGRAWLTSTCDAAVEFENSLSYLTASTS